MLRNLQSVVRVSMTKFSTNCHQFGSKTTMRSIAATTFQSSSKTLLSIFAVSAAVSLLITNDQRVKCESNAPLGRNFVSDVVAKVAPSVVNIMSVKEGGGYGGVINGSGFVVSKDGYIATNYHVVEKALDGRVLITFTNGERRLGKVHSIDPQSDIAIVKLDEKHNNLIVAKFGVSGKLRAGEFVVSIGSPLNMQNSASFGIVSAVARTATELGMTNNRSEYIQTDAACNVGNSGGPLANMDGEVVGMNTMTVEGTEGLSFAIPSDVARIVVQQLVATGKVLRPFVGLKMVPMLDGGIQKKRRLVVDLFETRDSLVVVMDVVAGSPAEKAGFKRGDVIAEVDGKKITAVRDVLECIRMEIGQTLKMRIRRPVERTPERLIEKSVEISLTTEAEPEEKKK